MKVVLIRGGHGAKDEGTHRLARAFSRAGYEVTILEWDREATLPKVESVDNYLCHRFRLKAPYGSLTVLLRLPFWELYQCYFLLKLKRKEVTIHACDFDTLLPALFAKFIKRTKLCYTIFDFYHDFPVNSPWFIKRTIVNVEKFALRFVDCLFMVNEDMYEEIRGAKVKEVAYIYNCPEDYCGIKELTSRDKVTLPIKIFYAGSITSIRGLKHMIDAVREVEDVKLIIAGTGTEEDVKAILDEELLISGKLEYLGWIPYKQVIEGDLNADILFYFVDPTSLNGKYSSPNKLFEAMMCGKPIIANKGSFMSKIVEEEKCGITVPFGNVDAIRDAVAKLRDDPELRQKLGRNGRNAYDRCYNWELMQKRLIEAYSKICEHEVMQPPAIISAEQNGNKEQPK